MSHLKHMFLTLFSLVALTTAGCEDDIFTEIENVLDSADAESTQELDTAAVHDGVPEQAPLPYSEEKAMEMDDIDALERPINAHIQLTYDQKPTDDRESSLDYDPAGWHNYQVPYIETNNERNEYWVMNRSHMIGYLFSGLNDEPKNLFTGTSHLNKGDYQGMNQNNENSMLYYEMNLNEWLKQNPGHKIDLQTTLIYEGDELIPRQVRMSYTGYAPDGTRVPIQFGSSLETQGNDATVVILENVEPNLDIDYETGRAEPIEKL